MKLLYEKKTEIKITHPKGLDFPLHVHEAIEIVLVLEGEFTGIVGNQRYSVGPGDIFLAFPNFILSTQPGVSSLLPFAGCLFCACRIRLPDLKCMHSCFHR